MRLLLDTHTYLWHIAGSSQLSASALALILDPANELFLSIASAWEITIKHSLGKLSLTQPLQTVLEVEPRRQGIASLPVSVEHLLRLDILPHHHGDPFDRMLVAQSFVENLTLLSRDTQLDAYGVQRLW